MMQQFEKAIRTHMASAERDMKKTEDRRGFVIGAVLRLWKAYHREKQIDESQFDELVDILSGFSNGEYQDCIKEQVTAYKSGRPLTIIGY